MNAAARALPLLLLATIAGCRAHGGAGPAAAAAAPAAAPASAPADWWNGAVFYEVFVRSFKDSNGDGIGDLRGLVERLDYLNDGDPATTSDLGVDALWLMPVLESPSYHGYDVVDYERVEADYGTNADLELLLAEAHRRGLRVVLDLVLNHTSVEHPWFVESASSASSPRRDWYVWSPTDPGWTQPWNPGQTAWTERNGAFYYSLFWGGMPDLNYRTEAVRAEAKRIAALWLGRGVDGFRLDAIRHLVETGPGEGQSGSPENHVFLRELRKVVVEAKPDAVLVGEVWSNTFDIADYYGTNGDELQLLFDFPLSTAIVEGVKAGSGETIAATLAEVQRTYPKGAVDAPFLTNHDQIRIATQLGNDRAKLGSAAAVLLTIPGAPFLYYGEELGMPNGPSGDDEWKRTPMAWDAGPNAGFTSAERPWQRSARTQAVAPAAAQSADAGSLLSRYRNLVRARKGSPALSRGGLELVAAPPALLAFLRRAGDEVVLVAHNLGASPADVTLPTAGATAEPIFADDGAALVRAAEGWRVTLPPAASGAWRVR
jgi:glycosidase